MARYDLYTNPDATERRHTPFFLDVQNDYIDDLATRVVVPLRRQSVFGPSARNLNPVVDVAGDRLVLDTAALGAVPLTELRQHAGDLRHARAAVQEALDALFGAH